MALENAGPPPAPTPLGALNAPSTPAPVVFDPAPHINAMEQQLKDWLNRPTQDLMREMGLTNDGQDAPHDPDSPAQPANSMGGGMIASLMGPLMGMMGMLGTGIFQGLDPSQMFEPITQAFQQGAQSLQGLMGQMGGAGGGAGAPANWAGIGATNSAIKTGQILGNNASIGAQATALGQQGVQAGATCQQGYARMFELANEINDRLSALAGGLFWTAPPMGETGAEGTERGTELITELEAELTELSALMAAIGAPQAVTAAPQAATDMMGPVMQSMSGLAGPAMKAASAPLTMGSKALGQGVQQATQMASQMGSQLGQGGNKGGAPTSPTGMPAHLAHSASTAGTGGSKTGGVGGGATPKPAAPAASLVSQNTTTTTNAATQSSAMRGVSTAGVAGTGMGGAPGAGAAGGAGRAGAGANGNGGHSAASFLHTTDQGGEIVGDLGNVAPPVIGAAGIDPDSPDVQLRI